jgi:hypothetical protein
MKLGSRQVVTSAALAALAALVLGCGGSPTETTAETGADAQASADLSAMKDFLVDHSNDLADQTAELRTVAEDYYDLAEASDFDYEAMLKDHRDEVAKLLDRGKKAYVVANPAYEQMEGIVAGVPELADYDVIIDAGSSGDDPENAVPFDLDLPNGQTLKQPGNFNFITETSFYGTNPDFLAKDVKADIDGNGKVDFGEGLPDANILVAAMTEFDHYANELKAAAEKYEPSDSDALTALVVMTPTMSEYFEAWKNSRFIAGAKGTPEFAAASRLQDIADILSGLVLVYDQVGPVVAEADKAQAEQTGKSLKELHEYAVDLRDREAGGEKFTAEQADTLGAEAQERAEAIAGQVSQAAQKLGIPVQEG